MKIVVLMILVCLFSSCFKTNDPEYLQLSDKISVPFSKKIEKRTGYLLIGTGGAFYTNVEAVFLTYFTEISKTIDAARKEFVETMEEMLMLYNENEEIRPFLDVYPFQPENFELLFIYNNDPRKNADQFAGSIKMMLGNVHYSFPPDINTGIQRKNLREPYSETYRKVYGHDRPQALPTLPEVFNNEVTE